MSEFSRLIDLSRLPPGETVQEIAAREEERAALARRFSLVALERLEARVRVQRLVGGLVQLAAELSADVVQECVVTLDPVASRVEDSFTLLYGAGEERAGEVTLDGASEVVEPLAGTTLDIGEAVAQQLSLALDPFPRAPGAAAAAGPDAEKAADRPFAALSKWKQKR